MRRRLGFSNEFMLIMVSISVFCVIVTGFVAFNITQDLNYKLVSDNLNQLNESTYNHIDSAVNASIKNHLRAIADKNKEIVEHYYMKFNNGKLTESDAKNQIRDILLSQSIGDTGYIYIVDSKGIIKVHPLIEGEDISEFDFIKDQIKMKEGYIEYLWKNPDDEREREKVLYMTYFGQWDYIISVSSYKSEFINLIEISDFRDNILSVQIGDTGYMYVMDGDGKLIIHPKQENVNIYDSVDSNGNYFIREIIDRKNGSIVYPWKNPDEKKLRDKIVVYKYYEPMDWYITSGVYIDELTKPIDKMRNLIIFITIFISLIAIIISLAYSKVLLKPIKNLIESMKHVSEGQYDDQIKDDRNDEIGMLTKIYNKMITDIKEIMTNLEISNLELEETNLNLEKKVKERTIQLELISNQDSLTGIANRRKMDEYLKHEWDVAKREYKPLSVILLDIDYYKKYNDEYGHPKGDETLILIVEAIVDSISRSSDFVARYGGEEFFVVMINTDSQGATEVAERIRENIEHLRIEHSKSEVSEFVTVSLGVSTIIDFNNKSINGLLEHTDKELYKAKNKGRNSVSISEY